MSWRERHQAVQDLLGRHEADAALVTHLPHIRWLCGFTGSRALLLVTPDESHFLTDTRYTVQSKQEVQGAQLHVGGGPFHKLVRTRGLLAYAKNVLLQPEYMSVADYHSWKQSFEKLKWTRVPQLLTRLVAVKSPNERSAMKEAQNITDRVFEEILGYIKAGKTERSIAATIDYRLRQLGAEASAFDTIVASGPNSARPHARPGMRTLQRGDCVIVDFGCVYNGMVSDMTRTVFIGQPSDQMRRVYDVVLEAQRRSVEISRANVEARQVDRAARQYIQEAGYGENFAHSTGHGLGYEVHEWPRISSDSEDILPQGCAVTIEPGIYLDGRFGIRIEDAIWVEEQGSRRLPTATRDLICL